jgi:hypothetical protein
VKNFHPVVRERSTAGEASSQSQLLKNNPVKQEITMTEASVIINMRNIFDLLRFHDSETCFVQLKSGDDGTAVTEPLNSCPATLPALTMALARGEGVALGSSVREEIIDWEKGIGPVP